MKSERPVPKLLPKGQVLHKVAQRYPGLPVQAMEVFLNIKRVVQEIDCDHQQSLEPHGLSEGKFFVLADLFSEELLGHDNPSPSEIAAHLGVTRATITGLLDGLERDGFLERLPDPKDRRGLTIRLTDKTRGLLDDFIPKTCLRVNAMMTDLTDTERQTLIQLIAKIGPPLP